MPCTRDFLQSCNSGDIEDRIQLMSDRSLSPTPPPPLLPTNTPAALSSLVIYNPSLGSTDATIHDQIVFYTSQSSTTSLNDRLRQIGLAQGIVEFARGFSKIADATSVDTQKSRIVMLQIEEPGWWILAQIQFACILNPTTSPPTSEYSSREVAPARLLECQLRTAYRQFCFHYGSFESNLLRLSRVAFMRRLDKYWLRWAWGRWNVTLSGSPAVSLFAGKATKMAAERPGREIHEQERDFLIRWVNKEKQRGLVDMFIGRFGHEQLDAIPTEVSKQATGDGLGSGLWSWSLAGTNTVSQPFPKKNKSDGLASLESTDGIVFQGTGSLHAQSAQDVATYLADLYIYGSKQAGLPGGSWSKKRRKKPTDTKEISPSAIRDSPRDHSLTQIPLAHKGLEHEPKLSSPLGLDSGLASPVVTEEPLCKLSSAEPQENIGKIVIESVNGIGRESVKRSASNDLNSRLLGVRTWGWTGWAHARTAAQPQPQPQGVVGKILGTKTATMAGSDATTQQLGQTVPVCGRRGSFLIGFHGDLDVDDLDYDKKRDRITSRNVWISRTHIDEFTPSDGSLDKSDTGLSVASSALEEHKIVIYINGSFLFAFVFTPTTPLLTSPAFYRSLHHQLSPLIIPLLSPSPGKCSLHAHRTFPGVSSVSLQSTSLETADTCYDILRYTRDRALYSTLPAIPEPGVESPEWTRTDALHVYTIVLGLLLDTSGIERSIRSTRGWWISWTRTDLGEGVVIKRMGTEGSGPEARSYFEILLKVKPEEANMSA